MEKTLNELHIEISQHSQKGIDFLKEGQEIHQAYQTAPAEKDLGEEMTAFTSKARGAIAELHKVIVLRTELIGKEREYMAKTLKDLELYL